MNITDLDKIDLPELPQKTSFQLNVSHKMNLFKVANSRSMFRFKSSSAQSPIE